jgi:hypothetical protein
MSPRNVSIKFRGREVYNPYARIAITVVLCFFMSIVFIMWILLFILAIILSPLLLVIHLILRACGRVGFGYTTPGGGYRIDIGLAAFKRQYH